MELRDWQNFMTPHPKIIKLAASPKITALFTPRGTREIIGSYGSIEFRLFKLGFTSWLVF